MLLSICLSPWSLVGLWTQHNLGINDLISLFRLCVSWLSMNDVFYKKLCWCTGQSFCTKCYNDLGVPWGCVLLTNLSMSSLPKSIGKDFWSPSRKSTWAKRYPLWSFHFRQNCTSRFKSLKWNLSWKLSSFLDRSKTSSTRSKKCWQFRMISWIPATDRSSIASS